LAYAPAPNDRYWPELWHLENLSTNAARLGIDLNARSAWSQSRGAGVTIAIVDDGVELAHHDLTNQAAAHLHWNFETDTPAGHHPSNSRMHGTSVAGLAVAEGGNSRGITGLAPEARFASWVIYNTNAASGTFVSSSQLAKMFQFHADSVAVQNHSWVKPGQPRVRMSDGENAAISNAVTFGRSGRGVVIVRAAGNNRVDGRNSNDDAYTADPRVITVAALRPDGRAASYSTSGASILVSAPGGELGIRTLFTTDRIGTRGYNPVTFPADPDLSDYVFAGFGFQGTSAAAPLISGVAALLLSANPNLAVRDIQQILLLSAYHPDTADPDLQTNSAGFVASHNAGFGLVNAGTAVDLARAWQPRSAAASISATVIQNLPIPNAGVILRASSDQGLPGGLDTSAALPSLGVFPEFSTRAAPLVFVGDATNDLATNLIGKAALIRRGGAPFDQKLQRAAAAGAEFAVIFNNQGTNEIQLMGATDFAGIPAVSISKSAGEALAAAAASQPVAAQIAQETASLSVPFAAAMLCEQVRVHLDFEHEQRGDLRITLLSPSGTRSILQRLGPDTTAVSGEWSFTSTHYFGESSQGAWQILVSDQTAAPSAAGTGIVHRATLEIMGVPIEDADRDGLNDPWEFAAFASLRFGPQDDPDRDGYYNAREQILGTDPARNENDFRLILSQWNRSIARINWPSVPGAQYEIIAATRLGEPFAVISTVTGGFPRTAWFSPSDAALQFFQLREKP